MTMEELYLGAIMAGIMLGFSIAVYLTKKRVDEAMVIGDFSNNIEDYSECPIEIIPKSSDQY